MTLILYILYAITDRKNTSDFLEWMYYGLRTFWLVFFSFSVGLHLALALSFDAFSKGQLLFLSLALSSAAALINFVTVKDPPIIKTVTVEVEKIIEMEKRVFVRPDSSCGVIYIMRRSDGILKLGKAQHLADRLRAHRKDYRTDFDVISSWVVPNVDDFESKALSLTKRYFYREGQRRELRQMSESELTQFILEFTNKVYQGWTQ